MSVLFQRDFNGNDGDPWDVDGWQRVLGAAFDAVIQSNTGHCGSTAADRVYRCISYPSFPNYIFKCLLKWSNAAGAARAGRLGLRVQSNGDGYYFEVDSNLGATRGRLFKRVAGVDTDIVGWTAMTTSSTSLNLGVVCEVRVENNESGEPVFDCTVAAEQVFVGQADTSKAFQSGGTIALGIGPNCTLNDIEYDTVSVLDFESENTSPDLGTGLSASIDGTYYTADELTALGISVGGIVQSYENSPVATLFEQRRVDDPFITTGMRVTLFWDGIALGQGTVRTSVQSLTTSEGWSYEVVSPKELADEVSITDPVTNAGTVHFNQTEGSKFWQQDRQGKTIGEIIRWIFDNHTEGDGGLRAAGAAPQTGEAYLTADLDLLTYVPKNYAVTGTVTQAIESLLTYAPAFGVRVDPDTLQWRFDDRSVAAKFDLDIAGRWLNGDVTIDPAANYTRILVRGSQPDAETREFSLADGTLVPGWDTSLNSEWDDQRAYRNEDDGTVQSIGVDGGNVALDPYITSAFIMVLGEWDETDLTFLDGAEAGETYRVKTNTSARITLEATAWRNGGPADGDTFRLKGAAGNGGRNNGFTEVARRWTLVGGENEALKSGACFSVEVINPQKNGEGKMVARTKATRDVNDPQSVTTDLPAIGWINYLSPPPEGPCDKGVTLAEDVRIKAPVYKLDDPNVPIIVEPVLGFRGTAYSRDPANWDGGGVPGPGDAGVRRTLTFNAPGFQNLALEGDEYRVMAAEMLKVLGSLARTGSVEIDGIELGLNGLNKRITIQDSSGRYNFADDLVDADDLWIMSTSFNPRLQSTMVNVGTLSSGRYDLGRIREMYLQTTRYDTQRSLEERLREVLECIENAMNAAGRGGSPDPTPICSDQVVLPNPGTTPAKPSKTVTEKLTIIKETIETIVNDLIGPNKGFDIEIEPDGRYKLTKDDGSVHYYDPDDGQWEDAGGNPASRPYEDLGDIEDNGIEGGLLAAILALAELVGKNKGFTVELINGDLVFTLPSGATQRFGLGDHDLDPGTPPTWGWFTPSDDPAPDEAGGSSPLTDIDELGGHEKSLLLWIDYLLVNAGKSSLFDVNADDGQPFISPPGATIPTGFTGEFHGAGDDGVGTSVPLPTGGVVPGNGTNQDFALKEMIGIELVSMNDPIGWIFSVPSGAIIQGSGGTPAFSASPQYFVAGPSDAAKPYLSSTFKGIRAAAGGAGTGVNGGDYEYTGELVTPVTAMRWRGPWEPLEDGHQRGEVVTDDGFTMVANKPTTERAAPQASGDPFYTIDGETFATVNDNVGVKVTGQRWTISQASNAGWIVDARVHIPDASPTIEYRTAYRINGGQWTLGAPLVVPGVGWFDVSATGSTVVRPGDVLEFGLYASETAAETVYGPHQWNYSSGGGANVPASGEAYERTSQNTIRFHYNDDGGTDRSADLTSVVAGSTIEDDAGRSWQVDSVLDVPGSSYVEYTVTPTGGPTTSGLRAFTFTVPTPAPTPHSEDAGYWTANPPSAGTIEGFVSLDGATPTYNDTAYGADLEFQPAYVSPDWDILAHSESTGGGGSSSWRVLAEDDGPVALPTSTPDTIITATVTGLTIGSEYRLALTGTVRASPTSNADYLLTFLIGTEYIFTVDKTPTVTAASPKTLNRGEKAILMAAAETVDVHFQVASEFGGAGNGTGIRLEVEVTPL